jgi:ABC-type nickel/cobalt efflux system permease component RcnA
VTALLTAGLLALALGLRHAVEPDHLAALSTLVAGGRGRRALGLGAAWGLGHTLSLLVVGLALGLLRAQASARFDDRFELAVAALLLFLGARSIWRAVRLGAQHAHHHTHDHAHDDGAPAHLHVGRLTVARAPLLVGVMHGLAGSGALTAGAMASMPTLPGAFWFLACFGLGATLGMTLLVGAAGVAVEKLARAPRWAAALSLLAGGLSLALGIQRGWPVAQRLFAL